ncbi:MAG TPA: hypothetical protein CFH81_08890 [Sulfurovum sp. UBA12169]|nr:MAG TPA: hypothetical protein CFH81_08890 [Sulfurovum sp. UBA12169]
MNDKELLDYLKSTFEESKTLTEGSRKEGRDAYEYMRGNQLPADVIEALEDRGQPATWENIYAKIDNKVEGMKLMTREDIVLLPRNFAKKDQFAVLSNVLKSVHENSEWKTYKKRADRDFRVVGLSVVEQSMHILDETDIKGKKVKEVVRKHIPALECFIDMYASNPDMSDQRYFHHSRLIHRPFLVRAFGEKAKNIAANDAEMVRVQRTWYRDQEWKIRFAIWTDEAVLEDVPTPFGKLDKFPLAIRRLNWSHRKEYYGMYRDLKPFQDTINFTMLRIKNMLGSNKVMIESDAVDDVHTFTDDFSIDESVMVLKPGSLIQKKVEIIKQTNDISQLMSIVQDARIQAELVMGLNAEALGSAVNRLSGYAIENRINQGLVGLQNFMDLSGEQDVDLAQNEIEIMKEHFSAEQIYYIEGKSGKEREQVVLNAYQRDDLGRMLYDAGRPLQENILEIGRYDVRFTRVPMNRGASGERQKNWAEVMKVLRPEVAERLVPSMLRDTESPEAEEAQRVIDEMNENIQPDPAAQQAQQLQIETMAAQLQKLQAQINEMNSKAELNKAKAAGIHGA